jgi:hypothetical protein
MAKFITSITGSFSGMVTHSDNTNHPFRGSVDTKINRETNAARVTGEDAMADPDVIADFVPLASLSGAGGVTNSLVSDVACSVNARISYNDGTHGDFAVVYEFGDARFIGSEDVHQDILNDTQGHLVEFNKMLTDTAGVTLA